MSLIETFLVWAASYAAVYFLACCAALYVIGRPPQGYRPVVRNGVIAALLFAAGFTFAEWLK